MTRVTRATRHAYNVLRGSGSRLHCHRGKKGDMRPTWSILGAGLVALLATSATYADQPITIDLTYDSTLDMVRPENLPGLHVHHNLHIQINDPGILSERRNRNIGPYADKNAMAQDIQESGEHADGVSWKVASDGTLIRKQDFPQSTRTMTVTLLPDRTCRLNVVERLKPGFSEYEFLRIKVHEMAYYRNFAIVATSCRIR